ncbi:MAG: PhoH family protein [[Eubacterium] siraeum]
MKRFSVIWNGLYRSRSACVYARQNADDSFIILDEAQNTTPEQMKMFLTRLGFNARWS